MYSHIMDERRKENAMKFDEIDEFWDFDNNDIGIYDCVANSRKKVFWKCYNNHTWIKLISSQINNRCPICKTRPDSGKKH